MIGGRLKRAREARGLSLRELAAAVQGLISPQAIGKYERNEMMPSSTVLIALCKALDVSLGFLMSKRDINLIEVDFRKAPQAGIRDERAIAAAVLDKVERYLELEELFPDFSVAVTELKEAPLPLSNVVDAEAASDDLRAKWSLGSDPIPSMAELLEENGIKVIALSLPESVSGSKAYVCRLGHPNIPVIVVNDQHNGERQRFTLAHELAHLVLLTGSLADKDAERAADRFAGAFLMPSEMMFRLLGRNRTSISLGELAEIKKVFKVSVASLVVRCSQLGIMSKVAYGRIWAQLQSLGWNGPASNEPYRFVAEVPQRMERLCLRAVAEEAISAARGAELLDISRPELCRRLKGLGMDD